MFGLNFADMCSDIEGVPAMRIQLDVSKQSAQQIKSLMYRADFKTHSDLFNNAVTVVEWAIRQVESGSVIAAVDTDRDRMRELSMPFLKHVAESRPAPAPSEHREEERKIEQGTPKTKAQGASSN
jgi:hypothetical protein